MLWAAACTGFFGFFRAEEFTVPSAEVYDPDTHLNLSDIALDSHAYPSVVRVSIKQRPLPPGRGYLYRSVRINSVSSSGTDPVSRKPLIGTRPPFCALHWGATHQGISGH